MIGNSKVEANFPHKLILTNREVSRLFKAFENNSAANIKLSKTQLSKTVKSEGFLGSLLRPLIKTGVSVMKNILYPLAKAFQCHWG